ncbi:type I secretion system permease/ATPase [Sphingomonas floccifaciens]|jgi:ATP-binding cassette, subfamily C, bacterial exporter for protease/lipase|uniref:Peptidase n=2 Tax=Sphingomonas TaxID=13687 RepID=A0A916TAF9_9SPHN|nr:type I secretion system permease/ATPase [Sphingomonas metalli]GGB37918.1 peptidase [Sphingomonas metalli]
MIDQPFRSGPVAAFALCRRHFVAAAVFSALVNLLYIAPTLYMLQVYDRVVPTQGLQTLAFVTLALLLALATLALLDRIRIRLLVRAGAQLDAVLAPLVLDATLGRPDAPFARQAIREFDALKGTLSGPGVLAVFDAPWVPIYILVCFLVHPLIGLLALAGGLVLPAIAWANERATRTRLDRAQAIANASYLNQEALLAAAESVRALGMRRAMVSRQLRHREAMLVAQTGASFQGGTYLSVTRFARLALQSLALGLGALLAVDNQISGGAIFASSFLIARALAPIEQLVGSWRPIAQARQSFRKLEALLADEPVGVDATRLPAPTGALDLEGITVINEARDSVALRSVSLRVAPGEVVAIVGPSGAGKSTLARVIAGALTPDRGTVRFDGADARDWDPEQIARHLGYLPQDSLLLAGSISENIARFAADRGEDRALIDSAVIAAAKKVGADDLIRRLPGGYDHRIAPGGRGLSAGQTQRIALARAVYDNPSILILDEPNAHLDAEGDAALLTALTQLKAEGRTILVVSHKRGILPVVDRMLVMREGAIELFGPRDAVLPKIAPARLRRVPATANS